MSDEASSEQKPSTTTVSSVAVQAGDASIVIAVLKVRQRLPACLFLSLCYSVINTSFQYSGQMSGKHKMVRQGHLISQYLTEFSWKLTLVSVHNYCLCLLGRWAFFFSNRINNLVKICRLLEGRNSSSSV